MRAIAEATKARGRVPTDAEVDRLLDDGFYLPSAGKTLHLRLKGAARSLVTTYLRRHGEDLYRVWETERPFELHLDGVTVAGRADVILDTEGGVPTALAIVDYKTSIDAGDEPDGPYELQLQVYTDAGRREGLDVRAAYLHDMKHDMTAAAGKAAARKPVPVDQVAIGEAEAVVAGAAGRIRARDYRPNPGPARCRRCEVRTVCAHGGG